MRSKKQILSGLVALCLVHCGGSSESDDKQGTAATSEGVCTSTTDCSGGAMCLAAPGQAGGCVPTCSINADDCSGTASCSQVATLSVNVCKKEEAASAGSPEAESEPDQSYIPCQSDADCQALDATAVCVTDTHGAKECAALCTEESDCAVPSVGGISVDFFKCTPDQTMPSRSACLFDPKCEADPLSCTSGFASPGTTDEPSFPGL